MGFGIESYGYAVAPQIAAGFVILYAFSDSALGGSWGVIG